MMRPGRPPQGTPPLIGPAPVSSMLDLYAEHLPHLRGAAYRVLVTLSMLRGAERACVVTRRSGLCDRSARIGARELEAIGLIVRYPSWRSIPHVWVCALEGQPLIPEHSRPAR
jgi:hypothetical protein